MSFLGTNLKMIPSNITVSYNLFVEAIYISGQKLYLCKHLVNLFQKCFINFIKSMINH